MREGVVRNLDRFFKGNESFIKINKANKKQLGGAKPHYIMQRTQFDAVAVFF